MYTIECTYITTYWAGAGAAHIRVAVRRYEVGRDGQTDRQTDG